MAQQDDQLIAQMAAQQLGAPAPEQAAPVQQQAPAPAADPKQDNPATNSEKIQEAVSPSTEGDMQREEAFIEVDFGDGRKEVMSATQIAGITSRYKDLNHKNATRYKPLEPAIDMLQSIMENARQQGHDVSGNDVAQFVPAAIQGFRSNPTMGEQQDPTPDRPDGADFDAKISAEIEQWERDNAVTLPPMYKQGMSLIRGLMQENQAMKMNVAQLLQQAQGINQVSQEQLQMAQNSGDLAYRQQAANNLNEAQQAFQLPDDAEDDFFNFAFGRGYSTEDFIDRDLTMKVMQDFTANRATPEMERLRALNEKRQAFTGAMNATPSVGGAAPSADANQSFIDSVAAQAMRKRGLA